MNLAHCLIVFIVVLALSEAIFWSRRRRRRRRRRSTPPPCSWSTCRYEWRDDWSPNIQNGRCVNQNRKVHHIYTTHNGVGSCPSTSHCSPQTQGRTMCSCANAYQCSLLTWSTWFGSVPQGTCGQQSRYRNYNTKIRYDLRVDNCNGIPSSCGARHYSYRTWCSCANAYYCPFHTWSTWSGSVPSGTCRKQSRYRDYNTKIRYDVRADNCNGIPSSCGARQYSYRTWCSCANAYHCPFHTWSTWSGSVSQGTCRKQSRYRDYNTKIRYDLRVDNCNGIHSSCGARQYNYRTWCSCRYASCSLGAWSSWSDLLSPVSNHHCASQERRRRYVASWLYLERTDNCDGVAPQSCPADLVEHQEKVITCPALPNPAHGSWNRDDCRTNSQACPSICQLRCDVVNGFQLQGPHMRECLPSGQWSTPWTSYCKDVRPPSITCPQSITVGTDPGKPTAKVDIPKASASDNSGHQPSITDSAGALQKEFAVSSTPHEVKYTATDAAGLTSTCTLQITVKDTERPRLSSCPRDIKHQTSKNEIRVTWPYPEFEDNFDRPPVQLRITSNRNPGVLFPWGRYQVLYTATDRAGNMAHCEFFVEVGPVNCTYFEAPTYGVRTCNRQITSSNNVSYEMICTVQCKDGYSFADPQAVNTYLCQSDGIWNRLLFGGQFPVPVHPRSQRPWPDCAPEENVISAKKNFNVYAGSCREDAQEALKRIRFNFLEAVKNSPLANFTLCGLSRGQDCEVENVKVYCGANSRRSLDFFGGQRIITFDFVIKDKNATYDRKMEAKRLREIMQNLDTLGDFLTDQRFSKDSRIPELHLDSTSSSVACPVGKVIVIKQGDGSELERTVCVECPAGTYYNNDSQTCENCQDGTFQNFTGQTSCHACPDGTWTVGSHARNFTECFDICEPGEYIVQEESGIINCMMCPIGTYQPKFRETNCLPCPSGKTTTKKGATNINDCHL